MSLDSKPTYEELEQRIRELEASAQHREQTGVDVLVESIQAGVVVHGPDGAVIRSNTTAQLMLGLTDEQVLGKGLDDPAWTFLREDDSPMRVEEYPVSRVLATGEPVYNMVVGAQRTDTTETTWVLDTAIPEFDENGDVVQVVTTFMDVTAYRYSEGLFHNLFEHMLHEVHLWKLVRDEHGMIKTWKLIEINPAALKAWGKTRPETIGKTADEIFLYETTEKFMPIVKKMFAEGTPYTWEEYFPPTDQLLYMTSVPFGDYFMSIGTDISSRKQLEDALRESEERHRLFYDPSFGGSIIHDKGQILDCSRGIAGITGYSHDELIGMDGLLLIAPDWRKFVREKIATGFEAPYEVEGIRKDGTIHPLRLHGKSIHYHGRLARVVEFRDISEIKKKEEEIQASKEFLDTVIDSSMIGMWISDREGTVIRANRSLCNTLDLAEDDIVGRYNVFKDANLETQGVMPKVKSVFETHTPARFTIFWRSAAVGDVDFRAGRDLYIDAYMFPVLDPQRDLTNVVCQWLDITEQKRDEIALQKSETFLSLAEEIAGVGSWGWDIVTDEISWSKGLFRILRRDPAAGAPRWAEHSAFFVAEDLERTYVLIEACRQRGTPYELEMRAIRSDGEIRHCVARGQAVREHDGTIRRLQGTLVDITDRIQAEHALERNERLLRNIIDSSTDYIFVKDKNLKTLLCNEAFAHAVNKEPPDLIGKTDVENGWDAELVKGNPQKNIRGYETDDLEALRGTPVRTTDAATIGGETLYLDSVKLPLTDETDTVFGILGISRDISERIKTERAVKESEERLRAFINNNPYPIVVTDPEHEQIIYWSKSATELFGHEPTTPTEWFRLSYPDLQYRQEVLDRARLSFEKARHSDTPVNTGEYRITCQNGNVRVCEIYAQFISGYLVLTHSDITGRKEAEGEIYRQLAEKQNLLREVHHRMKNNLAQVGSLLSLQAHSADSLDVKAALDDAASRVGSIVALYEKLLVGDAYVEVSVKNYLESVIRSLVEVYGTDQGIVIDTHIEDFALSSKNAAPLGIILNELVTNVFKYAFVGRNDGRVLIMIEKADSCVTLTVKDDGIGFEERGTASKKGGLGTTIVNVLAEQFDGTYSMDGKHGTTSTVTLYV